MDIFYFLAIFTVPVVLSFIAAFKNVKPGPFLGLSVFSGALSAVLTYLLLDFQAAIVQAVALAIGVTIFFVLIGLLGEIFTYRSHMVLLTVTALFPWGFILHWGETLSFVVWAYLGMLALNFIIALLIANVNRGKKAMYDKNGVLIKPKFILYFPVLLSFLFAGVASYYLI